MGGWGTQGMGCGRLSPPKHILGGLIPLVFSVCFTSEWKYWEAQRLGQISSESGMLLVGVFHVHHTWVGDCLLGPVAQPN